MKDKKLITPINKDAIAVMKNIKLFRGLIERLDPHDYEKLKETRLACVKGRKILEVEVDNIYKQIKEYMDEGGNPLADPEELFFTECDMEIERYEVAIALINMNIHSIEGLMIEHINNENKYLALHVLVTEEDYK